MLLHCQNCGTRYTVPDQAIAPEGRMVRCAQCGYSWLQKPEDMLSAEPDPVEENFPTQPKPDLEKIEPATEVESPVALPALVEKHAPKWMKLVAAALLVIAIGLTPYAFYRNIMQSHPEFAFLFEPFGMQYSNGLALADVRLVKDEEKKQVNVQCAVINEANGSRDLPHVIVTVLDKEGSAIVQSENLMKEGDVKSGESIPCEPYAFEMSGEAKRVRIDLGGSFDIAKRAE